ncbi:ankyrin repeat domain-containing protein [Cerasicoccus arenae]|uniref:Ankyrin repeat domain-containing protein n=1 Tax=Cerasicoccus arenae TaxID=424488 RepID=A0A8J3DDF4_9BACT|nr:ankyrin repeat domain-containing protein [Cerasicoccus arenae]MBK1858760.1 hypothetical protein [Cerasicoccus arenae]GHC07320.1 hypothetical protein GCM10007047_25550 [Cerasicoccus arenae]
MNTSKNRHDPIRRQLPERPDLQQIKRQAKELIARYNNGDSATRQEVEFYFPKLQEPLQHSQAILIIARSHGYASWSRLKAFVDGVTVARFCDAAKAGDVGTLKSMAKKRPELVKMELAPDDERIALHFAVMNNQADAVRWLMQAGSDARKGIYPYRDVSSALDLSKRSGSEAINKIIEEEEQRRRENASCPNVTVSPAQDKINQLIKEGSDADVLALMKLNHDLLRSCDRDGCTPLHRAAEQSRLSLVEAMIAQGAPVFKEDLSGMNALEYALHRPRWERHGTPERIAIARRLEKAGVEPSLLSLAALGEIEKLKRVHEQSSDGFHRIQESIDWQTGGLMSQAVRFGQLDLLAWLLEIGLDPDERTRLGGVEDEIWSEGRPLWLAAANSDLTAAKLLLDAGANPDGNVYASGVALDRAYENKDEKMKALLLKHGAKFMSWTLCYHNEVERAPQWIEDNPDKINDLLWAAAGRGSLAITRMGFDKLDWPGDDNHWFNILAETMSGLYWGVERVDEFLEVFDFYLDNGISPNVMGKRGVTLAHHVIGRCPGHITESIRIRFLKQLIEKGAVLTARDEVLQATPLGWACRWGYAEVAAYLLASGVESDEADAPPWARPRAIAESYGHFRLLSNILN